MSRPFLRLRNKRKSLFAWPPNACECSQHKTVTVNENVDVLATRQRRWFSRTVVRQNNNKYEYLQADPSLVRDQMAPGIWWKSHPATNSNRRLRLQHPPAVVYPQVISEEEASAISQELLGHRLRRRRYEKGHWDAVITNYREIELYDIHERLEAKATAMEPSNDTDTDTDTPLQIMTRVVGRLRSHLQSVHLSGDDDDERSISWLPCHAIDLNKTGQLQAHVDSVRFSGHLVAGLSLLSPAIMRLRYPPPEDEDPEHGHGHGHDHADTDTDDAPGHVDLLLPPRSLYVLTGVARYDCSHELLPDGAVFHPNNRNNNNKGEPIHVPRDQRLSIIFRDAKNE